MDYSIDPQSDEEAENLLRHGKGQYGDYIVAEYRMLREQGYTIAEACLKALISFQQGAAASGAMG